MGRRSAIGAALLMVSALILAVPVLAGTKTNVGKVDGDSNSQVIAKVKTKRGKPKTLTTLEFTRVDLRCRHGHPDSESDAKFTNVKVKKAGKKYAFSISQIDQYGRRGATGTVKKDGKKVKGEVNFANPLCKGGGSFSAKG